MFGCSNASTAHYILAFFVRNFASFIRCLFFVIRIVRLLVVIVVDSRLFVEFESAQSGSDEARYRSERPGQLEIEKRRKKSEDRKVSAMTVDNLNNDLQDLENYLKNVKNKGCNVDDLNIVLNVLQCPVFKNIVTVQNSLRELKKATLKHPSLGNANFIITTDGKLELIDLPLDEGGQSKDELNDSGKSNLSEEDEKRFWQYIERAAKGREVMKVNLFKSQNECLGFNVVGLRAEQVENLGIFVENIAKNGIADR